MLLSSVSWPSAPFTNSLVLKSLSRLSIPYSIVSISDIVPAESKRLQWSTYDEIDHELTHIYRDRCLSSSYTIRKALIRKHYLSRCIHSYIIKNPLSFLVDACPKTFEIEISFADELDELWLDELWELAEKLEESGSWWILKPGMADRGMGIRLFNTKETLQRIFDEFESDSEGEHDDGFASDSRTMSTTIVTSQLRHFVIQEYINNPLLIDPSETANASQSKSDGLNGYKFHLRAYCIANGALELYLYDRVLALFSAVPYGSPRVDEELRTIDLSPHLTNTSLQAHQSEESVRLLQELVGCHILSSNHDTARRVTSEDIEFMVHQMGKILSETFKAALQMPVHFQPLPNAFELFGVDFLVTHEDNADPSEAFPFRLKLLEINAEPAIELTGPRLSWILEDLFNSIGVVCIEPFFANIAKEESWITGQTRNHLMKCLAVQIR